MKTEKLPATVSIDNSHEMRGTVLSDRLDVRDPEGYSPLPPGLSGFLNFLLPLRSAGDQQGQTFVASSF